MESYGIEEARNQLGGLVERARLNGEHIGITRYGKEAVVLVPAGWRDEMLAVTGIAGDAQRGQP